MSIRQIKVIDSLLLLVLVAAAPMNAQTAGAWPDITVALYDCNSGSATVDSASQSMALHSASVYIYQGLLQDTSSRHLQFFNYGLTDSLTIDSSFNGMSIFLPDSNRLVEAQYVIASKITGSPGNYTLTVSLEDGHTFAHAVDGIAAFSSATSNAVATAVTAALSQIIPLVPKIRNFQETLKLNDPSLVINPKVVITSAAGAIPLNNSTTIWVTLTDCDGLALQNQPVSLEATAGSLSSSNLITNNNGVASTMLLAGTKSDISTISATIQNVLTVTGDTINPTGTEFVKIGSPDTTGIGVCEFSIARKSAGFKDKMDNANGSWDQSTKLSTYSYSGKCKGTLLSYGGTAMFVGDTMKGSGGLFAHTFSKHTVFERGANPCPGIAWAMSGSTSNAGTKSKISGLVEMNYDLDPTKCSFAIEGISYNGLTYSYTWNQTAHIRNAACVIGDTLVQSYQAKNDLLGLSYTVNHDSGFDIAAVTLPNNNTGFEISISTVFTESDGTYNVTTCEATINPFSSHKPTAAGPRNPVPTQTNRLSFKESTGFTLVFFPHHTLPAELFVYDVSGKTTEHFKNIVGREFLWEHKHLSGMYLVKAVVDGRVIAAKIMLAKAK
jgi:hypothetical protein